MNELNLFLFGNYFQISNLKKEIKILNVNFKN